MQKIDFKKPQVHFGFFMREESIFDMIKIFFDCKLIRTREEKYFKTYKIIWFVMGEKKTIFEAKIYNNEYYPSNFHIGIHVKHISRLYRSHKQQAKKIGSAKIEIGDIFYTKSFASYFIIFDKQITFEVIEYFSNDF